MTTLEELDDRVSVLEEYVRHDLSVRVDAMNMAVSQTRKNTEVMCVDLAGIKVDLAHLDATTHTGMAALRTALDLRISETRHDLSDAEVSIRHDMRMFRNSAMERFEGTDVRFQELGEQLAGMNERFTGVDERFAQVDARFDRVDERFAQVDARFDKVDERFAQVDARFDRVDARFDRMDGRFDSLENKLDAFIRSIVADRGSSAGRC